MEKQLHSKFSYVLLPLLLGLINTSLFSCGDSCSDLTFTNQVRENFLDFREGSYWIYRNVANGDIDSVYFVSQTANLQTGGRAFGRSVCTMEEATVNLRGFANDLPFGYSIKSWNTEMEINNYSAIAFRGDYDVTKPTNEVLGGNTYRDVIHLTHCCSNGCNSACDKNYFRFLRLSYSPRIGMVLWEAENHPQYGNAVYELIRYKVIR